MATLVLLFLTLNVYVLSSQSIIFKTGDNDVFNVLDYGAVGNGHVEDTQACENAWKALCKSTASSPTMHIPARKAYLLQPLTFSGPCKPQNTTIVIDGNLLAPSRPSSWACPQMNCPQWIAFYDLNGLFIHGSGTFDGRGKKWWDPSCRHRDCRRKPTVSIDLCFCG